MVGVEVLDASADEVADLTAVSRAVTRADPTDRPEVPPIAPSELDAILFRFPADKPARTWLARDTRTGAPVGWVVARRCS